MAFLRGKMVHCQRYYHHLKKGEVVISSFVDVYNSSARANTLCSNKRGGNPRMFFLLFLCLLSCALIISFSPPGFSFLCSLGAENEKIDFCSSVSNGTMCCDRSSHRTDVCIMKGDVRTDSSSFSVFLKTSKVGKQEENSIDFQAEEEEQVEKIRPYTRKWEASTMSRIDELKLVSTSKESRVPGKCDVYHDVPAVFFSTGGYTGNVYHEFNDGLLPLYITSQHFEKKVVFVIVEFHDWWLTKYANILTHLTDYAPIDFNNDKRVHCFPEAIVGLRIHDELTVDSSLMPGNESIKDFRELLDRAYWPRIKGIIEEEKRNEQQIILQHRTSQSPSYSHVKPKLGGFGFGGSRKPKLAILSRDGSRSITNEALLVQMAQRIGFNVEVVKPGRTSELAKIYRVLNSSDVMIGVHGAAMTHFLFMKPSCVFIQVIPLGTEWAAATYYGEPAMKLGLKYIGYQILPRESSLYNDYDRDDPVLRDPKSVADKGWEYTKKIYLDNQNIQLDLRRFKKRLFRAYDYVSRPRIQPLLTAQ